MRSTQRTWARSRPSSTHGHRCRCTVAVRRGPVFRQALETFGVSLLKVNVATVSSYPHLVAVVLAGKRVITHGAVVPKKGTNTIRLANYVQYLPKGTRLTLQF